MRKFWIQVFDQTGPEENIVENNILPMLTKLRNLVVHVSEGKYFAAKHFLLLSKRRNVFKCLIDPSSETEVMMQLILIHV